MPRTFIVGCRRSPQRSQRVSSTGDSGLSGCALLTLISSGVSCVGGPPHSGQPPVISSSLASLPSSLTMPPVPELIPDALVSLVFHPVEI
jgi:hypothetical protein